VKNDPDPFHSGFVYAQSVAVTNGLLPFKNFLSPYGAIGPMLNGLWLQLVNNSLLSLLTLYGLITIFSGLLMQRQISRLSNPALGIILNLVWVLMLATAMPWPSILTTFLTLFAVGLLLNNLSKIVDPSAPSHLYVIPSVLAFQLATLTRIHLLITPLIISIFLILKRKSINPHFFRMWFATQAAVAAIFTTVLHILGMLGPFINQVIIWPSTSFEKPDVNFSFIFSFIWFPISLLIVAFLVKIIISAKQSNVRSYLQYFLMVPILVYFYFMHYFSIYDFPDGETNSLKSLPGFIKTASTNLQFMPSYAAGTLAIFLLLFFCFKIFFSNRGPMEDSKVLELWLMATLCVTGWVQLYPLHDNVHLWFVTPLLVIPSIFFLKEFFPDFSTFIKPLIVIFSCFLSIQLLALYSFLSIDRVPLRSKELHGMMASVDFRDTTDRTMNLLDEYVTTRNLRNNCTASLFSVSNRNYRSIDGNFSENFFGLFVQSTPIVDPAKISPELVFECSIDSNRKMQILELGFEVVFEVKHPGNYRSKSTLYNVLFKRTSTSLGTL
jgi:hypothetical protein